MSHNRGLFSVLFLCFFTVSVASPEILINVNVNKPIHDVSEQFVSFSIPPELLFDTLDGSNKKTISGMATLLGPSYLRLTGDYFFPSDMKSSLKNPTQSIWSGFNRWTRAMNWTMVIPVQYTPMSWDPIEALRVLNTSNSVGIDKCIWQLGLDFGALGAEDYVADLNTLDTMVDTFRPYVKNWKVIGADITAGSSADETKRYIDISRNVNAAYGWTQPAGYHVEENVNGYIYDKDVSLKAMLEKKVPVWLSIPPKGPVNQISNGYSSIEVSEAIRWAQTLGDAASTGFNAVFKPLSSEDVTAPNYSFFVSALFKKIMGNRVFPAKPVKRYSYSSKLYTHCANGISGGIAFMGVNTEDYPIKITAKTSAKFTGSEVWQFILISKKGALYLNNEELTLNSTLEPLVRIKHPNKPLAINMPPMSVGFWVLPLANHEDCQFTELLSSYNPDSQYEAKQRKQTSTDRLLKKLILETSLTDAMKNRRRRDLSSNKQSSPANIRQRRFILQGSPSVPVTATVGQPMSLEDRNLKKRENAAHNWFKTLITNPAALPKVDWGLKRSRRGADFLSTLFPSENNAPAKLFQGRQSAASTKERFASETNIFKKATFNAEADLPTGDVHVKYITNTDGEEINTKESREEQETQKETPTQTRELPSEFYEAIAYNNFQQPKASKNSAVHKKKANEVSAISGLTQYMKKNQLENHFGIFQKESKKADKSSFPSDFQEKPTSVFGTELTLERYPSEQQDDDLEKYLSDSAETDSFKSFFSPKKSSNPWAMRARRSIEFGKLKSWKDNLITKDDDLQKLSYIIPEMSENVEAETIEPTVEKAAGDTKNRVSKILTAVKDHLSGLFNSLIH